MTQSIYTSFVSVLVLSVVFAQWQDQNSPPKVKISLHGEGNTFRWNSIMPYTISVSDAEDGDTEYDEIPSHEILLVARYLPDSTFLKERRFDEEMIRDHNVVLALSKAQCFNCHAAKAKLIGPSFEQVAARYENDADAVELLTRKIIDGSTGKWSDLKMPPHPDLKEQDVKEMVTWILKNNSDPDFIYFIGKEGSLKTKDKSTNVSAAGVYVLTASYMDYGLRNSNNGLGTQGKRGQHTVVLRSRE